MGSAMSSSEELKFPKQIFVIFVTVILDRFAFYAFASKAFGFLKGFVGYQATTTGLILSAATGLGYSFPILGAVVADCWFGKYVAIISFLVIYICGMLIMTLSAVETLGLSSEICYFIGFFLISAGSGTIKPCLITLGGDQFTLPQQKKQVNFFYYAYYFLGNLGIGCGFLVASEIVIMNCNNNEYCYSASFGLAAILLTTFFIIFLVARRCLTIIKPETNIMILWVKCVGHALKEKTKSTTKVDNWLDRSEERYGKKLVYHIKSNFKVLSVFLPLMIYGILDLNINTVWILQASLMNGELGTGNIVEPKKMLTANPVLILIWIPLICLVIYPVCARYNLITTPLQRIGCGGMFVGVAYFISGFISLAIESNVASLPSKGECHLRMFNPLTCSIKINAPPYVDNVEVVSMGYKFVNVPKVEGINIVDYKITGCEHVISNVSGHDFLLIEEKSISYFITTKGLNRYIDKIKKYSQDNPQIRTLVGNPEERPGSLTYKFQNQILNVQSDDFSLIQVHTGTYFLEKERELTFHRGDIYTVLLFIESGKIKEMRQYEITAQNKLHMFWQIPQYLFFTMGEAMLVPTALEFAYTQSPLSMKTLMTAAFFLIETFGSITVGTIRQIYPFKNQSNELFVFGGLTFLVMFGFMFCARRYKYFDDYQFEESETNTFK